MRTSPAPDGLLYIAERRRRKGNKDPKMDHLVCFLPGSVSLLQPLFFSLSPSVTCLQSLFFSLSPSVSRLQSLFFSLSSFSLSSSVSLLQHKLNVQSGVSYTEMQHNMLAMMLALMKPGSATFLDTCRGHCHTLQSAVLSSSNILASATTGWGAPRDACTAA